MFFFCDVVCPAGPAPAATARLQRLKLQECVPARQGTQALEQRLFPLLTSLTCLNVGGYYNKELRACFRPHISTMASLQQLQLEGVGEAGHRQ
jgi:hypothetical protein